MFGRCDKSAFDGVVVQVVEFLEHHRVGADGFGVGAFGNEGPLRGRAFAFTPRPASSGTTTIPPAGR